MRSLDVIKQKRRFLMFNKKTIEKVLEVNSFFGKYNLHYDEKIKKTFTYYDTPDNDLLKSRIILFKTSIGKLTELNMATEKTSATSRYVLRSNYKHFKKQIKNSDNLMRHKEFLIENFKSMFLSGVNFDPEFLMQKLRPKYILSTKSKEYRSTNGTGLKVTYSFDEDVYYDITNNIKVNNNVLTIYQHSAENTNEDFEDLISKLTRYCKELTATEETKIMLARRLTQQEKEKYQEKLKKAQEMKYKKSK